MNLALEPDTGVIWIGGSGFSYLGTASNPDYMSVEIEVTSSGITFVLEGMNVNIQTTLYLDYFDYHIAVYGTNGMTLDLISTDLYTSLVSK